VAQITDAGETLLALLLSVKPPTIETHIIKLPKRTGELRVTERSDLIVAELSFDRYGDLGDIAEVETWLGSIFAKYDEDARPVCLRHPLTGELAIVP
jgi:hypothetical protein